MALEEFTTAIRLTESRRQLLIEVISDALESYEKEKRKMLTGILEQLTDGDA